jgi:membrane protein DedA with SNARE-associated domain
MITEALSFVINWLLNAISQLGYLGIFIGMTIESSFFPFPSEIILTPAGALAAQGQMSFLLILLFGILGSLTGALINYFLALFLGRTTIEFLVKKYGSFLFLKQASLKKSDMYFKEKGEVTTFVGRLIPVVRQLISLPAGFSRMNLAKFSFYTCLGAGLWSLILISLGYFLGNNSELLKQNLSIITLALAILGIIFLVYYIYKKRKR